MSHLTYMSCCGIAELADICEDYGFDPNTSRRNYAPALSMKTVVDNFRGGLVIFSTLADDSYGIQLKKYIEDNKFGSVVVLTEFENPNSGNDLTVYAWTLDVEALGLGTYADRNPEESDDDGDY